mmetsp:Transcript_74942/g.194889  ORF Transcript_74942/g.194889 Transcript_74942/m.194889 type:complete len:291 (-) Transcript_74942:542-1414(-)
MHCTTCRFRQGVCCGPPLVNAGQIGEAVLRCLRPRSLECRKPTRFIIGELLDPPVARAGGCIPVATVLHLAIATALPALAAIATTATIARPATITAGAALQAASGTVEAGAATEGTIVVLDDDRDGLARDPCAAILAGSQHGPSVVGIGQANVGIEHHLLAPWITVAASVGPLPLVLGQVPCHSPLRSPALGQHRHVVVVVEAAAVFWVAPPAIITRVLDMRAAQGVHPHQSRGAAPVEAQAVDEGLFDGGAASLRIWQPACHEGARLPGRASESEALFEDYLLGAWIGG